MKEEVANRDQGALIQTFKSSIARLPECLRLRVRHHWEDFVAAGRVPDLPSLPTIDSPLLEYLPHVWACSEFVAQNCIRHPDLLGGLIRSGDLERPYQPGEVAAKATAAFGGIEGEQALMRQVRQFRRREMVRLAWRDLSGAADLAEVTHTLSGLADACLHHCLTYLHDQAVTSWGSPIGSEGGTPVQVVVIALGKLGGGELNFSSDVDLMLAYPEDGQTDGQSPISNHEFFTRLTQRLIRVISEVTEDGFAFRMDLRLRPNGDSGPLVLSFDAMEHYYQTHGRDWERYALIKARPAAGDRAAGEALLHRLQPFVYRKYLDYGAFESIRSMKARIEAELRRKAISDNIKLGPGGIREIEFIAQSFQLIRGGRDRRLQTSRLRDAFACLAQVGVLGEATVAELIDAYQLLRNVEHRLQMVADLQTHRLPTDDLERARLAFAAGFSDWSAFHAFLRRAMKRVHLHFEDVFATSEETARHPEDHMLMDLWLGAYESEEATRLLKRVGFDDAEAAGRILDHLRTGHMYQSYSTWARDRLDQLMPRLIHAAGGSSDPMIALARLSDLLYSIGRRAAYISMLAENPLALQQLVRLACASPWIASWICQHPLLLDELLYPVSSYDAETPNALDRELERLLGGIAAGDLEAQMDILREVRHGHVLRVAAADLATKIGVEQVALQLSIIADAALKHSLIVASNSLAAKLPTLESEASSAPDGLGFAVIAYGKLGSQELGYNSDLDIIFLYDVDGIDHLLARTRSATSASQYTLRLGQRLVHVVTTRTGAGSLYEIDMRLRPSGRSGPLVSTVDAFESYQQERAWTWEHQALVRARAVTGDLALCQQFERVRQTILCQRRDAQTLRADVAAMRSKMASARQQSEGSIPALKHERGGIVDIEFIVQYYVLLWAADFPQLTGFRSNIEILDALADTGVLGERALNTLKRAYRRYLVAEYQFQLTDRSPPIDAGELADLRALVAVIWDETFG